MKKLLQFLTCFLIWAIAGHAQTSTGAGDFKLALPNHQGQLQWRADGFKIVQSSAKPNGVEARIRGNDLSSGLAFLGFLFLFPEQSPMTSTKCRDGVMDPMKKGSPTLNVLASSEMARSDGPPLELVNYSMQSRDGKFHYSIRGFIAVGDICGDFEIYSQAPINPDEPNLKAIWSSYRFEPSYTPQFKDVTFYAEILFQNHMYQAAAPIFEQALTLLKDDSDKDTLMWRRLTTDQAGMSYGIAGNVPKGRALFNAAIAKDPDYPMNYYNLACADAQEKNLADARTHLQQAFARKANMIGSETMPDPTKDDSFLPYRDNKDFWTFVEGLR